MLHFHSGFRRPWHIASKCSAMQRRQNMRKGKKFIVKSRDMILTLHSYQTNDFFDILFRLNQHLTDLSVSMPYQTARKMMSIIGDDQMSLICFRTKVGCSHRYRMDHFMIPSFDSCTCFTKEEMNE